jgi:error-prone DNA polymerase
MGLPDEAIRFLAKKVHGGIPPAQLESALARRPELRDSHIPRERFRWVFRLAERMTDLPRNMRAHSSGVIVSRDPICDYVPVQHSGVDCVPIIQWDKRSAKRCFDKFDVLCLRGQDVLSQTEEGIRKLQLDFCVEDVPIDDPETYRSIRSGNLIGIPQSASPAMRQAHVRLRTENLTDASLVQAGIRPGVGGAVKINELIERRRGKPYQFDHPKLREILGNTYGIIVFQEQVDQLLQEFAGYTSGEAEDIREAIHKRRREEYGKQIRDEVCQRIVNQGFAQSIAEMVYEYVSGFNGYGFAQGHALAFAEISVRSVWCQQNYPSEYFSALLNAQPAGYYGPTTIANEARNRGVRILRPDLNLSAMDCCPEDVRADQDPQIVVPNGGIRIGLSYLFGVQQETRHRILAAQPFASFFDFVRRVQPARDELECLVRAGVIDSLQPHRRALFWSIPLALRDGHTVPNGLPLEFDEPLLPLDLPDFTPRQRAVFDRRMLGMDVEQHLMGFERPRILQKGGLTTRQVQEMPPGTKCFAVGNPIRLRFPPTQSGKRVVFFDLEDETGLLNVTCFDRAYQKFGKAIICSPYLTVVGRVQDRDGHPAFLLEQAYAYQPDLRFDFPEDESLPLPAADFIYGGARVGGRK